MATKKVNFVWAVPGWRWEATHYNGHGIFFGRVTSPYVPQGEYGTWYLWEIEGSGARLVKGDKKKLDEIKKKKYRERYCGYSKNNDGVMNNGKMAQRL